MSAWRSLQLWLLLLLGAGLACHFQGYRLAKALNGRDAVLDTGYQEGPDLVRAWYDPGGLPIKMRGTRRLPSIPYELVIDDASGNLRPPILYSRSAILLELAPGIDPSAVRLRAFLKNDPILGSDLVEVHTLVGEIPGTLSNEVTFLADLFPRAHPRMVLYPEDLAGPYQGVQLQAHDWIILQIEDLDSGARQRLVFEYIQVGPRAAVGAHLLFSTGINLIDVFAPDSQDDRENIGPGQINTNSLDLAFTLTASLGYRGTAARGVGRWFGDNFSLVLDVGVGNVGEIEKIVGGGTENAISILQNQFLVGFGVQFFDTLSFHLLNNVVANFSVGSQEVEAVLVPEIGIDVAAATRFGRRLYERLFFPTSRRTYGEGVARPPMRGPEPRPLLTAPQAPVSAELPSSPLLFDESSGPAYRSPQR